MTPEEMALAFAEIRHLDDAAEYLARGRTYRGVPGDQLGPMYLRAYADLAADPAAFGDKLRPIDDLAAEHRLRGQEPPLPPHEQIRRANQWVTQAFDRLDDEGEELALAHFRRMLGTDRPKN